VEGPTECGRRCCRRLGSERAVGRSGNLADERCGRAVLDFLSTTDVGRRIVPGEEDAVSDVGDGVAGVLGGAGSGGEV